MAGDVGTGRVDHMGQIDIREKLLDQLLAELALHERVGGDLARVAGTVRRRPRMASWKMRSANGTDREYLPEQLW